MYRDMASSLLHHSTRLFQEYIVDNYAKMEDQRLNFIRRNQNTIRCEKYNNLHDTLTSRDSDLSQIGKHIILPSSFIGSPRHMYQLYQDAMSIVRKYGKPDLFVTFTCNPRWIEIQRELLRDPKSGKLLEQAADRPDLCARVFNIKLNQLKQLIIKDQHFGKVYNNILE